MFIFWCNIIKSIPLSWQTSTELKSFHKRDLVNVFNGLTTKSVYKCFVNFKCERPVSEIKFEQRYTVAKEDWDDLYMIPYRATCESHLIAFQFKVNHNILYTNEMLFKTGMVHSSSCSFCNAELETVDHMLFNCFVLKPLWEYILNKYLSVIDVNINLCVKNVIFGLPEMSQTSVLINHIILIAKRYVYECKLNKTRAHVNTFNRRLKSVMNVERKIAFENGLLPRYEAKWNAIEHVV